ncbi:MAG: hypothetical protein M1837_006395 [Sclerophora amabilis]|nr:MAG: hypothetical protein M1837_006395 [Sclerophora amabilis]
MIFTAVGSIAILQALGLVYGQAPKSEGQYQTGQCWGMDAKSAGRLTVLDAKKTKECCEAMDNVVNTYAMDLEGDNYGTVESAQQQGAVFFERNGDDLERCSIPGADHNAYLDVEKFKKCCGGDWKPEPAVDVPTARCCGGKPESKTLKDIEEANEVYNRPNVCVVTQADIDNQPRGEPWLKKQLTLLNSPSTNTGWDANPDVVLLEENDCPKDRDQSMFSGAWFWQGEKTALYTDGKDGEILGLKKPWDQKLPPLKVPFAT